VDPTPQRKEGVENAREGEMGPMHPSEATRERLRQGRGEEEKEQEKKNHPSLPL